MSKLNMHTPDLTAANVAKIASLFPNCVTESRDDKGNLRTSVDFDLLRQELNGDIVEGPVERYTLNWPGKRESIVAANTPVYKTLRPCVEESVNFDTTKNLYIEGDNLEVLKLLQETYLGKVKMIYIDPPYNTGNDFIYDDDFAEDVETDLLKSSQKDESGGRLVANTESNGRFHSDWLTMMYPRLKLACDLLSEDGIIFISIDDHEIHNLRKLCDEIYGADNFVGILSVENNPKGRKNSKYISVCNDYCLIYSKKKTQSYFIENIPKSATDLIEDENGTFVHNSGKRVLVGENKFNSVVVNFRSAKNYSVYYNGKDIKLRQENTVSERDNTLISEGYKRYCSFKDGMLVENTYTMDKFSELFTNGAIDFKEDKIFEKNFSVSTRIKSLLTNREYEAIVSNKRKKVIIDLKTTSAGTELKEMFGTEEAIFTAPKTTSFLKLLSKLFDDSEIIVLDFFSGSSTTAHAVMQLNAEDGGTRRFIMVQLPEVCDEKSEAFKAGYKTICEIGKERIRRAGKKIKEENATNAPSLDVGFRVFKVDTSNMKEVYYTPDALEQSKLDLFADAIKEDRTAEDLLFQVFLDCGLDLSLPVAKETVEGHVVYAVDGNAMVACFTSDVSEPLIRALAKRQPIRAVFLDRSFGKDSTKLNVTQIFKQLSPNTEVKTL